MSQAEHILKIRALLAKIPAGHWCTSHYISDQLDIPELQIRSALAQMIGQELVYTYSYEGCVNYAKAASFVWRKITPLFAGTPEHIVESFEGKLMCWCPSEFSARLIADALNRS